MHCQQETILTVVFLAAGPKTKGNLEFIGKALDNRGEKQDLPRQY